MYIRVKPSGFFSYNICFWYALLKRYKILCSNHSLWMIRWQVITSFKSVTHFFLYSVLTWKLMIDSLHIPQYLYRIFHAGVAQSIDLTMTHNNIMMVHSCLFEVMLTPVSWLYVTTMKQTDCHVVYLLRLMDTIRRVHSEQNHLLNNLNDYIHWLF